MAKRALGGEALHSQVFATVPMSYIAAAFQCVEKEVTSSVHITSFLENYKFCYRP